MQRAWTPLSLVICTDQQEERQNTKCYFWVCPTHMLGLTKGFLVPRAMNNGCISTVQFPFWCCLINFFKPSWWYSIVIIAIQNWWLLHWFALDVCLKAVHITSISTTHGRKLKHYKGNVLVSWGKRFNPNNLFHDVKNPGLKTAVYVWRRQTCSRRRRKLIWTN